MRDAVATAQVGGTIAAGGYSTSGVDAKKRESARNTRGGSRSGLSAPARMWTPCHVLCRDPGDIDSIVAAVGIPEVIVMQ